MLLPFRAAARAFALSALVVLSGSVLSHGFEVGDLEIEHPWSRATVPGAKVAAGYFVVKNTGSEPDRLVSVSSTISDKAEIHEMAVDSAGVMTMRPIEGGLEIPAGGEVKLAPKGLHIMFISLTTKQLVEDESFKATLNFEKGGPVEVEFSVEAMGDDHGTH